MKFETMITSVAVAGMILASQGMANDGQMDTTVAAGLEAPEAVDGIETIDLGETGRYVYDVWYGCCPPAVCYPFFWRAVQWDCWGNPVKWVLLRG